MESKRWVGGVKEVGGWSQRGGWVESKRWVGGVKEVSGWSQGGGWVESKRWVGGVKEVGGWSQEGGCVLRYGSGITTAPPSLGAFVKLKRIKELLYTSQSLTNEDHLSSANCSYRACW